MDVNGSSKGAPIPKSVRRERIAENLDMFGSEMMAADMEVIAALDIRKSLVFDQIDKREADD